MGLVVRSTFLLFVRSKWLGLPEVRIEDWDENVLTEFSVKEYVEGGYSDNGYLAYWMPTGEYVTAAKGAAIIRIGTRFRPLSACLVSASVYDWSAMPHKEDRNSTRYNQNFGYGDSANATSGDCWCEPFTGNTTADFYETKAGDYCYVTPLYDRLDGTTTYQYAGNQTNYAVTDSISFINGRAGIDVIKDSYYEDDGTYVEPSGLSYGYLLLGYSNSISTWDTVIVKNRDIYVKLNTNSAWMRNDETGTLYNNSNDWIGTVPTYYCTPWPLDATSSYVKDMTINSSIGGYYDILVNPTGLGDWTGQSPEAILETCWAMCKIQKCDYYSDDDLREDIHDFYLTFYGLDIDKYGTEMNTILAGPES